MAMTQNDDSNARQRREDAQARAAEARAEAAQASARAAEARARVAEARLAREQAEGRAGGEWVERMIAFLRDPSHRDGALSAAQAFREEQHGLR